jgi:hypothetical protein
MRVPRGLLALQTVQERPEAVPFGILDFPLFYRSFANAIGQPPPKLREDLSAAMVLRKRWLATLAEQDKRAFQGAVDRIVIQLREDGKSTKAEMAAAGSVEGQNLLRIREVEALEAGAAASKRTADAMETQGKELREIRQCLEALVTRPARGGRRLSF